MFRRTRNDDSSPSYDSFLDIVANLVGILVILITVIGVRAQAAWLDREETAPDETIAIEMPDVATAQSESDQLSIVLKRLDKSRTELEEQFTEQANHREKLLQSIETQEKQVQKQKTTIDKQRAQESNQDHLINSARQELIQLRRQLGAVEADGHSPTIVKHYPTPLAKTVFGREEHFRLLQGRLVYVPMEALTSQLKREAEHKVWKLRDATRITETIGPVAGFHLRYTLARRTVVTPTGSSNIVRQQVELVKFILIPTSYDLGQPLEEALKFGSDFRTRLDQYDPNSTTITVWTYPDSFAEFRRLKEFLRQQGFLAAARPLPAGHPIGGSPNGSRSQAQ